MEYEGIRLTPPKGPVHMTHSVILDAITGKDSTENMDWTDRLGSVPWGAVKKHFPDSFEEASRICSLLNMCYQVNNGGVGQYFFNRYHENREPQNINDVERVDLEAQKETFLELVKFAASIYPERVNENQHLANAPNAFQKLEYREDEPYTETIYSDEEEYIEDPEDPEKQIKNPAYEEPYDETYYEDVIIGENEFESLFFDYASDYMEELLEMRSQFAYLVLEKEMVENREDPEIVQLLQELQNNQAPSFDTLLEQAEERTQKASPHRIEDPQISK